MLTGFKVIVNVTAYVDTAPMISKYVIEQKILTITDKWVTFDEGGTKVRVPRNSVFLDVEEAKREADERANVLISKLVMLIELLKQPAKAETSPWVNLQHEENQD